MAVPKYWNGSTWVPLLAGPKGDTGATGATGASGPAGADGADGVDANLTFVNHGAVAGTARPSGYDAVVWYGSVQPTNAVAPDIVIRTDETV